MYIIVLKKIFFQVWNFIKNFSVRNKFYYKKFSNSSKFFFLFIFIFL